VRDRARRCAALAAAAFALAFLGLPAAAQETEKPAKPVHEPTLQESRDILQSRNRNVMHPGDPLLLVGVDQGDNDMRARTPALENSNKVVLQVDQDEAYHRALAMYDSGATFKSALSPATGEDATSVRKSSPARFQRGVPVEAGSQWPWLVALGISIAFMVWLGKHFAEPTPGRRAP
jgi:hypothetical protein